MAKSFNLIISLSVSNKDVMRYLGFKFLPPQIAIIEFIKKEEKEKEEKSIFSALKVWDYFHFSSLCF